MSHVVDFTYDVDWKSPSRSGYFPHQEHALRLLRGRFQASEAAVFLVMPMGSGKTRVVGGLCRDFRRSLVVVPPQLIPQIADLLKEGASGGSVLEASTGKALLKLSLESEDFPSGSVVVTSFKIASNVFASSERCVSNHFDFMAVDEAHLLPNASTKFFPDGQRKRVLFMSATPGERAKYLADVVYELRSTPALRGHCGMDQDVLFTAVHVELSPERLLAYWQELWASAVERAHRDRSQPPKYWTLAGCCHHALERLVPLGDKGLRVLDALLPVALAQVPGTSVPAIVIRAMAAVKTPECLRRFRDAHRSYLYKPESSKPIESFKSEHERWWTRACWETMPSIIDKLERGSRLVYTVETLAEVEYTTKQLRAASRGRAVHAGNAKCPGHRLGVVLHHDREERYRGSARSLAKHLDGGHWPMRLQKKLLTSTLKPPRHRVLGNAGIADIIWQYLAPPAYIFVVSTDTITVGFNLQNHADGMLCSKKPSKGSSAIQLAGRWVRANGRKRAKPPQIFYPHVEGTDEDLMPPSLFALLKPRAGPHDDYDASEV